MKKFKILIYYFFFLNSFNLYADTTVYEIKAKTVNYDNNEKTIIATGNAEARNQENQKIFADKIIYNKDLDFITTEGNSRFIDNKNLSISAYSFEYDLKLRTILATKNVIIKLNGEIYKFDDFKYYELNEFGSGNKFKGQFKDGSTVLAESAEINQQSGIKTLVKTKYTPCKETAGINNEFCPNWSARSSSAVHDKEEKTITYKNTLLYLKNIPVMYAPYLTVPDPTVKRQSGFLSPSFKKISNVGPTLKIPYFFAIADDADLTFTPIFYSKENNLYMLNYRQAFKNSYLEIDTSYTKGYDDLNKTGRTSGSRSHLFADFHGTFEDVLLNQTDLKLKLQNVNNSTYFLVNQINNNLVKQDLRNLENSFELNAYGEQNAFSFRVATLQNLDATTPNKYEYVLPQIGYSTYKTIYNHQINFSSSFVSKNFNTNQNQQNFTNAISTTSEQYILKNYGLGTVLKTNVTNINLNNDNVTGQKQDLFSDNYFTIALDNSYPLYHKDVDSNISQNLNPRVFIKYTTGSMANLQSTQKILTYNDIYSMNRMSDSTNPETGFSIGAGFDWDLIKKDLENKELFKSNFSLGQVFKKTRENNMPNSSSLQNTSSDIVGSYNLNYYGEQNSFKNVNNIKDIPNYSKNSVGFNYQFNLNNNFSSISRNLITLSSVYDTNYLGISFEQKNNEIGNSKSVLLNFKKVLFDSYFFNAETKKNYVDNYTEYTNVGIFKEDDCIKFGFGFNKQGYANKDLEPGKSFYFTITFKPFGEPTNFDLSSFVK